MTTRIAHLADTHLGYRQYGLLEREEDFYDAFNKIIDDIIEKDVDYVIHAGDLFETPKPPIKALLVAQKGFEKLKEHNIQVYVIAGNHDIMQRRKTSLPQELYKNENFHILTSKVNNYILDNNIFLGGLPYISKNSEEAVKELLKEITEKSRNYPWKILMLHGAVRKYFDFEPEFELDTIPEGYDYYAMGHLHKRINDKFKEGALVYPGSTEIRTKDELDNYHKKGKGYTLITIDDTIKHEFINMELERKFIVRNIQYPKLDEELESIQKEITTILEKTTKKPVVDLKIYHGKFDRSDIVDKIYDALDDITLTIRISYESLENSVKLNENIEDNLLTPENAIKDRLTEEFNNEAISTLGLELYKNLSTQNIEKAQDIAEEYYEKNYHENNN
ncbi:DNA repair exonuclease [uncultured Methanosphaera sp.]|uniref:metallophosphoesterase family protein n=1 Tax=uncultured Methanosphaera sp. TaxID=262501 RepID=UPI000DC5D70B|nr:DNA repair exonuclease [uncultured Methanosphaera sp.]RAP43676.1 MAG: hypothetical protein BZ134_05985 [Methanosphaera sp. SHI1033]